MMHGVTNIKISVQYHNTVVILKQFISIMMLIKCVCVCVYMCMCIYFPIFPHTQHHVWVD